MDEKPWKGWIPGVLCQGQMQELCSLGFITGTDDPPTLDPSSIDLHLADEGYCLPEGCTKPFGGKYLHVIQREKLSGILDKEPDGGFTLKARETYLFRVREELNLPEVNIHGQATAKSSVGRLDVLARLIVDGMDLYDCFNPEGLKVGKGKMYLEITPLTFPIRVKAGVSLSQLRLFYGAPDDSVMKGKELYMALLQSGDDEREPDGSLSLDLSPTLIAGKEAVAYCALSETQPGPISLWAEKYSIIRDEYFDIIAYKDCKRLVIKKSEFYILRSKEKIALPSDVAVYCRATDENIGEMRIHYAGFVHPWFGFERADGQKGTPLIFEVRGHDLHVVLRDWEKMAKLIFYRMSRTADKPKDEDYNEQTLKLSKLFRERDERDASPSSGLGRSEP